MSEVSNRRFVHFDGTKDEFIDGGYPDQYQESIVFINGDGNESNNTIYTHGEYYGQGVIVEGDASNSAVLKNGNNKTAGEHSVAIGKNNVSGLKGWYYNNIKPVSGNSKQINVYLTDKQTLPTWGSTTPSYTGSSNANLLSILGKGVIISLVNDSKYDNYFKIVNGREGMVQLETVNGKSIPFSKITEELVWDPDDYSIYCVDSPLSGDFIIGNGSTASGYNNKATNTYATSFGYGNHAYGKFSFAAGRENYAGYAAYAVGRQNYAIGVGSYAEGYDTRAIGNGSHSEGQHGLAIGQASHVEGYTPIIDSSSISVYQNGTKQEILDVWNTTKSSVAKGIGSHVEGRNNLSYGNYTHTEGEDNIATGRSSHAEGHNTSALHDFSHTSGESTISSCTYSTIIGKYNNPSTNNIFEVGIGTSSNRKNGFSVDLDGSTNTLGTSNTRDSSVTSHIFAGKGNQITKKCYKYKHLRPINNNIVMVFLTKTDVLPTTSSTSVTKDTGINPFGDGLVVKGDDATLIINGIKYKGYVYNGSDGQVQINFDEGAPTISIGSLSSYHNSKYCLYFDDKNIGTDVLNLSSYMMGEYNKANGDYSLCVGSYTETCNDNEVAIGKYNYSQHGTLFSVGNGSLSNRKNIFEVRGDDVWLWCKDKNGYVNMNDILKKKLVNVYDKNSNIIIDASEATSFIKYGEVVNKNGYVLKHDFYVDDLFHRTVYYNYIDNVTRNVISYNDSFNKISSTVLYSDGNIKKLSSFSGFTEDFNAEWIKYDDIVSLSDVNTGHLQFLVAYKNSYPFISFYYDNLPIEERVLNPVNTNTHNIGYDIIETTDKYIFAFYNSPSDPYSEYYAASCTQMPQTGNNLIITSFSGTTIKIDEDTYIPYIYYDDFNSDENHYPPINLRNLLGYGFDTITMDRNNIITIQDSSTHTAKYVDDFEFFQDTEIEVDAYVGEIILGYYNKIVSIKISGQVWDTSEDDYIYMSKTFDYTYNMFRHTVSHREMADCKLTDNITISIEFYGSNYNIIYMSYSYDFEYNNILDLSIVLCNKKSN